MCNNQPLNEHITRREEWEAYTSQIKINKTQTKGRRRVGEMKKRWKNSDENMPIAYNWNTKKNKVD
jgi:hypothetical protein